MELLLAGQLTTAAGGRGWPRLFWRRRCQGSASQSAPLSWGTLLLRAGVRHKSWRNSSSLSASALALALTPGVAAGHRAAPRRRAAPTLGSMALTRGSRLGPPLWAQFPLRLPRAGLSARPGLSPRVSYASLGGRPPPLQKSRRPSYPAIPGCCPVGASLTRLALPSHLGYTAASRWRVRPPASETAPVGGGGETSGAAWRGGPGPRRMPDPWVAGKPASWAGGGAGGRCGSGWALKPPAGRGGPTLAWTEGRTGLRADRALSFGGQMNVAVARQRGAQ